MVCLLVGHTYTDTHRWWGKSTPAMGSDWTDTLTEDEKLQLLQKLLMLMSIKANRMHLNSILYCI